MSTRTEADACGTGGPLQAPPGEQLAQGLHHGEDLGELEGVRIPHLYPSRPLTTTGIWHTQVIGNSPSLQRAPCSRLMFPSSFTPSVEALYLTTTFSYLLPSAIES